MQVVRAGWVLPVEGAPIRDGAVAVEDGRIAWVGPAAEAPATAEDLGPGVLLPGLVNAHCHLELTHLAGLDPAGGFVAWVRRLVEERPRHGEDASRAGAIRGIGLLLDAGTAAVGDVSNALLHLDALAEAPLDAVVFHEVFTLDPARATAVADEAAARIAALDPSLGSRHVHVRLGAHAPHTVAPELFAGLRAHGGPAFLHLAESPAEVRYLQDGTGPWAHFLRERGIGASFTPPGLSPVRYVDGLGVLRPGLLAAHCVQAGPKDRELLAARGVHVALCPSSNRRLGCGLPDLPALLEAGVALSLGTDSLASGDSLDVRDEAVLLHEAFPSVPAERIVHMLTQGGADALGIGDLGAIARGRRAALAYAAADEVRADPHEHVLRRETVVRRVARP
jgi:cytosine/adenosine deaminase-related metal-dependent hydrolase